MEEGVAHGALRRRVAICLPGRGCPSPLKYRESRGVKPYLGPSIVETVMIACKDRSPLAGIAVDTQVLGV